MRRIDKLLPPQDQIDRLLEQARREADYWFGSDDETCKPPPSKTRHQRPHHEDGTRVTTGFNDHLYD